MVRIGLIGYGSMGETHLKQYREIGEDIVKVVALADIRKERLDAAAEICEFKAYNSAKELIENKDFDLLEKLNMLYFKNPQVKTDYICFPITAEEINENQTRLYIKRRWR